MEKLTGGGGSRVVVVGGEQCVQCARIFSILAARTASCAGSSDFKRSSLASDPQEKGLLPGPLVVAVRAHPHFQALG